MNGPELAVGGVAVSDDRLLLVRRGHGPAAGEWSVPGGRVAAGEPVEAAVVREVLEETGLDVVVDELLGWVERFDDDRHFVILDFRVTVLDPDAPVRAGDDAAEAAWVPIPDLGSYRLVAGLVDFLEAVDVLTDLHRLPTPPTDS
ncbi:MAG TPA: NUDIX domain-containing protein [Acidimicrobiia bacterium]|nr:NUDIX domain-containing protein [Acidimicrobiia bacterium]